MLFRCLILGWALLAVAACDRGASLYAKAAEAEKAGQLDDARWQYEKVARTFAKSKKAPDAQRSFVRLSLDAAEKALAAGDPNTCQARLGEAEPFLVDPVEKKRFAKLMAAKRSAEILAGQSEAIRQFVSRVASLATEEARARPIEQQAAFKWDEFVVPHMNPAQRFHLHLGMLGNVMRKEFEFGDIKRVGEGRYVLEVVTKTSYVAEQSEWYMQATTNGWRIVCAQKPGGADCKDPWAYKPIKGE